jgi:two-component system phosphate regulon sensor histidine kinase PhoR
MALRLQSRLILWNLLLILVISIVAAFFLTTSQIAFMMVIAVALTAILSYSVHVLILGPLREISLVSRKLAAGNLNERLPIAGDEEIAALSASLNTMARVLSARMQALSDGKQQLELILEAMGQGVMVLDHDGRITFTNTSLLKVLATGRDLVGRTPLEVFRQPELESAVKGVLGGGPIQTMEIVGGHNRVLQATVAPVTSTAGTVNSAVTVFHDLTEIRRVERMRRDFIANVSHEFKTPLTSIRGYTETLLSGAMDDPKIATDFLSTIERNAQHLEALVSDLLMLAKLEAELPAEREHFDLMGVIKEQVGSRKGALMDRGIQVTVECPEIEIQADRARLATALSNLIDNAISYNKSGGQIRISAERTNGTLNLSVTDTGNGIPSEELHRIFERFYRVDKSRTRESGGTGLGLSIVKHAIESQGGVIDVTSKIGLGSTFTIHLPA